MAVLDGIVSGDIDLAFRRWKRPTVKPGTRQRTPAGIVEVTAIDEIDLDEISNDEALRAGASSAAEIRGWLRSREGTVYRIGLRYAGPDPRVELRARPIETDQEFTEVAEALARFDRASRHGPWSEAVLRAIEASPHTLAADLAASFGREKQPFKTDARKLKELGLTESLNPGYRLSPRGESYLEWLDRAD